MEIKNLENKQMIIHQKENTKIHTHELKNGKCKDKSAVQSVFIDKEKNITIDKSKSNSIKSGIKNVGTGAVTVVTGQIEGGKEIQQAAYIANQFSRPVKYTASKSKELLKQRAQLKKRRKLKQVDLKKKITKKKVKNTSKKIVKKIAKDTSKKVAKKTAKTTAKVASTVAGTAMTGPFGFLIGIAAGEAVGAKIEKKDRKRTSRNRKIKFFLDKTKAQNKQKDSVQSLIKDLIVNQIKRPVKGMILAGIGLLFFALLSLIVTFPQIAVIATIYNSPFAIFLPPLEDGDTVMTVTSAYMAEFNRNINTLANEHIDCDEGDIVYVDYEGEEANPSNYYDILAVYMVKYGIGDTATIINDTSKENLKSVFDDMCMYIIEKKKETITAEDGTTSQKNIFHVKVTLKTYKDMITEYGLDSDKKAILEEMMSSENLAMLGYTGSGSQSLDVTSVSSMTQEEINVVVSSISDPIKKQVASFAFSKVGYPYSQEYRDSGNYYDCSSLAYYAWKSAGVDISYNGATTAAAEAEGLDKSGKTVSYDEMQPGDLIFYSYCKNGRYKNISHVAVYIGNGKIVEARSTKYGVICRAVPNIGCIASICRPK